MVIFMADEKPDNVVIAHKKSTNFISAYADGCHIGGPTTQGHYHLLFFADMAEMESETGSQLPNGTIQLNPQPRFAPIREDRAIISMSEAALKNFAVVIQAYFAAKDAANSTKN